MKSWKAARQTGLFDDIACFGIQLKKYGDKYSLHILQQFADDLILQVSNFDIEKMMATLNSYPGLIIKIKSLHQEQSQGETRFEGKIEPERKIRSQGEIQ